MPAAQPVTNTLSCGRSRPNSTATTSPTGGKREAPRPLAIAVTGDYCNPRPALIARADAFRAIGAVTALRRTSELQDWPTFRITFKPSADCTIIQTPRNRPPSLSDNDTKPRKIGRNWRFDGVRVVERHPHLG
jgi:hypothetical protein